jgi:hypothetical protein
MAVTNVRCSAGEIQIGVHQADALTYGADVLVLKYAQQLHGADAGAAAVLGETYGGIVSEMPKPDDYRTYDAREPLGAKHVIFLGVPPLRAFGYKEIRYFGRNALRITALTYPEARSIALTVHGPGYGLDEIECFRSLVAGLLDQLNASEWPELKQISILENVSRRVVRFSKELDLLLKPSQVNTNRSEGINTDLMSDAPERLRSAGLASESKRLLFVAMPFRDDMADLYDYGILNAAERAGFLCERADQAHFTGDVLDWVRARIEAATLVVADLSYANPNVYLEVGYAWGRGKPTILLMREGDDLKFDVKGQRCLIYTRIKDLEQRLHSELCSLKPA